MLYMDFNVPEEKMLVIPESWYDAYYNPDWFNDPEIVRVACEIDGLTHVWADFFTHPYTGRCCGKDISGGAKTVIVTYLGVPDNKIIPLSWLGGGELYTCVGVIRYKTRCNVRWGPSTSDKRFRL